jgi:hypothetical protein
MVIDPKEAEGADESVMEILVSFDKYLESFYTCGKEPTNHKKVA